MPPSESLREQIVLAVMARLDTMVAGTTYFHTPASVGREVLSFDEVKSFPYFCVVDGDEAPHGEDNVDVHETFQVMICGWISQVMAGNTEQVGRRTVLNRAVSDVKKVIAVDETFGGLVVYCEAPSVATDSPGILDEPFAYFELTLPVHYDRERINA